MPVSGARTGGARQVTVTGFWILWSMAGYLPLQREIVMATLMVPFILLILPSPDPMVAYLTATFLSP
jgi:hypothetical protein